MLKHLSGLKSEIWAMSSSPFAKLKYYYSILKCLKINIQFKKKKKYNFFPFIIFIYYLTNNATKIKSQI